MFILAMNDMRYAHVETIKELCWASTIQELDDFLNSETVEYYKDGQWGKQYRKGGPLEWKNPPFEFDSYAIQVPEFVEIHGIMYTNPVPILPSLEQFKNTIG
jgi:hypothetical protein